MKRIILDNERVFNEVVIAQQQQVEQHEREIVKHNQEKLQLEQNKLQLEKEKLQLEQNKFQFEKATISHVQQKINFENEILQQQIKQQKEEIRKLYETVGRQLYETVEKQQELLADLNLSDMNSDINIANNSQIGGAIENGEYPALSNLFLSAPILDSGGQLNIEHSIGSLSEHSNIDYDAQLTFTPQLSDDSFVQINGDGDYS